MRLWINGEEIDTPALETVAGLAEWLQLPAFGSAVEVNGHVIRRVEHASTKVQPGDRIEVVRLVGGG